MKLLFHSSSLLDKYFFSMFFPLKYDYYTIRSFKTLFHQMLQKSKYLTVEQLSEKMIFGFTITQLELLKQRDLFFHGGGVQIKHCVKRTTLLIFLFVSWDGGNLKKNQNVYTGRFSEETSVEKLLNYFR